MTESKCTAQLTKQIVKCIEAGATLPHACAACHISWNTVQVWLRRDQRTREPYKTFIEAVEMARGRWAAGVEQSLHVADDPKVQMWLLSKRVPDVYGDLAKIELTGKDGGPIQTAALSDDEIAAQLAAIAAGKAGDDD